MSDLQSNGNELGFVVNMKIDELKKQMKEYDQRLDKMEAHTQETTDAMDGMFKKLGSLAGAYFSVNMLKDFTQKLINVRGQFQQLEIAFGTMLGNEERASKLMRELTDTASRTPFNLSDVAQGAKQLLAYGSASEEVNETLVRLGNIASGLSIPLNDLVYLYGTTQTQGRLFTQDVRQFMGRGIPLVKELAKELGKTENEINAMVSAGEIGFDNVKKAIENMTNEGGMFFQLMEKQSASLTGQISNLEDAFDSMLNEIGKGTQDYLSKGISSIAYLVENYKTLGKVIATIAEVYGTYKLAVIMTSVVEKAEMIQKEGLIALMKKQIIVQKALNAVTKLNPYVAMASAVVGLVAVLYTWKYNIDTLSDAQDRLNKKMSEFDEKQKEELQRTNQLISIIQDKTKAVWEQVDAYNELQKYENIASGMSIDEVRSMSSETLQAKNDLRQYEKTLEKYDTELAKAKIDFAKAKDDLAQATGGNVVIDDNDGRLAEYKNNIIAIETERAKYQLEYQRREKQIAEQKMTSEERSLMYQEKLNKATKRRNEINDELNNLSSNATGKAYNYRKKLLEDEKKQLDSFIAFYERANAQLETSDKEEVKNYIYWQKKKQEATKAYQEAEAFSPEYYKAKKEIDEATEQMAKWDDKIKKTKKEIDDLTAKWKKLADESSRENELLDLTEFDRMRKENSNAYKEKINELERQRNEDIKKSDGAKATIDAINQSYNTLVENQKRTFEITNKKIDDEERDYLDGLRNQMEDYNRTSLEKEINQITKDADDAIKELEAKVSQGKLLEADYKGLKDKIKDTKEARIEDAEVQATITNEQRMLDLRVREIELTKNLRGEEQAELDIMHEREESLTRQIKALENQKHGLTEAEQIQLQELRAQLSQLGIDIKTFQARIKDMRDILSEMFGQIGGSMSNSSNSYMQSFGNLFQQLGSSISTSKSVSSKMQSGDKYGAYSEAIGSAVSGAVEMFNLIYDQAQANKQALAEWDDAIRTSAQKLRMLELEAMDWEDSNIWGNADPYKKLQSYLDKSLKAQELSISALEELGNGKVQTGLKKEVDTQKTLTGLGIGASVGASIGSIFSAFGGMIGAIVGGATGGITSLLATRKEVAVYNSLKNQYGNLYDGDTLEINKQILADYDKMDEATQKLIDNAKELLSVQKETMDEYKSYVAELTGDISQGLSDSLIEAFKNEELYNAIGDFKNYIQTQIESIVQQEVFYSVFGDLIDNLSYQLTEGITNSEGMITGNIEERLSEFPTQIDELMGTYNQLMTAYQDIFKKGGYEIFKATSEATQEALQGTISSMSEDTATKLNGNFMGLKLSAMEINANVGQMRSLSAEANDILKSSLSLMNRIANNTDYCENLNRLNELADDIAEIKRNGLVVR